jgi:hypothetical protein
MVFCSVGLLLLTVHRWAKWFFAACCGNAIRFLAMAILGRTSSVPSIPAARTVFMLAAGIAAVMGFLTYRFTIHNPNRVDAICLVAALAATVYSILSAAPLWTMLVAILLLTLAFAYDRLRPGKYRARQPVNVA